MAVVCAAPAFAGVTIYFQGSVKDSASIEKIAKAACAEAEKNRWRCHRLFGDEIERLDIVSVKMLLEIEPSKDISRARGVVVYIHEMADPLYLVFGPSLKTSNYIKTQFAGAGVHIQVIELLEKISPFFIALGARDEGEYWETRDRAKLEKALSDAAASIAKAKRPGFRSPVRQPDGRILDFAQR